jgi:hypothetical protein
MFVDHYSLLLLLAGFPVGRGLVGISKRVTFGEPDHGNANFRVRG